MNPAYQSTMNTLLDLIAAAHLNDDESVQMVAESMTLEEMCLALPMAVGTLLPAIETFVDLGLYDSVTDWIADMREASDKQAAK